MHPTTTRPLALALVLTRQALTVARLGWSSCFSTLPPALAASTASQPKATSKPSKTRRRGPKEQLQPRVVWPSWRDRLAPPAEESPIEPPVQLTLTTKPAATTTTANKDKAPKQRRYIDAFHLSSAVQASIKRTGNVDEALEWLRGSPRANRAAPAWNPVLLHLARSGRYTAARDLYGEMKKRGVAPDNYSHAHVFAALARSTAMPADTKAQVATELFAKLANVSSNSFSGSRGAGTGAAGAKVQPKKQPPLSPHTVNAYLTALSRAGNDAPTSARLVTAAFLGLASAQSTHVPLDAASATIALQAVARDSSRDAAPVLRVALVNVMRSQPPRAWDADLLGAVAAAARRAKDPATATVALWLARELGVRKHLVVDRSMLPDWIFGTTGDDNTTTKALVPPGATAMPLDAKTANWVMLAAQTADRLAPPQRKEEQQKLLMTERAYAGLTASVASGKGLDDLATIILATSLANTPDLRGPRVLVGMYAATKGIAVGLTPAKSGSAQQPPQWPTSPARLPAHLTLPAGVMSAVAVALRRCIHDVVRAGQAPSSVAQELVAALTAEPALLLGSILNAVPAEVKRARSDLDVQLVLAARALVAPPSSSGTPVLSLGTMGGSDAAEAGDVWQMPPHDPTVAVASLAARRALANLPTLSEPVLAALSTVIEWLQRKDRSLGTEPWDVARAAVGQAIQGRQS